MKFIYTIIFLAASILGPAQSQREATNFDFDWKFLLEDIPEAKKADYDDSNWQEVQLPHDWSIKHPLSKENAGIDWMEGSMGYLPGGIGWYRKGFQLPKSDEGKKVVIQFDGVYHQSDVYINGEHLGFHPYGYTTFEYDLTPYLNYGGENTIAVRVDHSDAPSSRWYSGSGISRYVEYKAGKIEAKGYKDGRAAADYELKTAGAPAQILLSADCTQLTADGQDLSHITIRLADDQGVVIPNADQEIMVEVVGNGRLLGLDNGDLRRNSFAGNSLPTYFGKALLTVQSDRSEGSIKVIVKSKGFPDETLQISTK